MDILDELTQAYSFTRDELIGKAISEIAQQRRHIENLSREHSELRHENQILIEINRDLHWKLEYEKKH